MMFISRGEKNRAKFARPPAKKFKTTYESSLCQIGAAQQSSQWTTISPQPNHPHLPPR